MNAHLPRIQIRHPKIINSQYENISFTLYRRLNSTGEEEEEEEEGVDSDIGIDECPSATSSSSSMPPSPLPANFNFEEHYTYLAARERLQEFPGQVPQKKKKVVVVEEKAEAVNTQKKPKSKVSSKTIFLHCK